MPSEQKQWKYKCLEPCCAMLIRSDKWTEHCRSKHVFKFSRKMVIKYKTVEMKETGGKWREIHTTDMLENVSIADTQSGADSISPTCPEQSVSTKTELCTINSEVGIQRGR